MSKVFVVQRQLRKNYISGQMESQFNLDPAKEYGVLVEVVSPEALPFRPGSVIKEMHAVLREFTTRDYLLLVGNPCLIGWATAIAAQYSGGLVRQLQWNGRTSTYSVIEARVFDTDSACPSDPGGYARTKPKGDR